MAAGDSDWGCVPARLPPGADAPKLIWLMDIRDEINPVIVGTAPLPENAAELCRRGGRFGAHNLQPSLPGSVRLKNTFLGTFFNGGVRAYRLRDSGVPGAPPHAEEVGYYIPAAPVGNPAGAVSINHVLVDERGLIYICDRVAGGLYILEYTGTPPLD